MPQLSHWTQGLDLEHLDGALDPTVHGVTADSRRVQPGDVFVAIRGTEADGSDYISQAIAQGAAAVVLGHREGLPGSTEGASVFWVHDPRRVLAQLARSRHHAPDRELRLVAVTGTNGKTTVSWLGAQLLDLLGEPAGCLGTIRYRTGLRDVAADWTTPPVEELFALLREMCEAGRVACVLEASSHALDQDRIGEAEVDVAAFTNLSREHLEYHRDLDDYLRAKLRLLERLDGPARHKPTGRAVVNMNDVILSRVEWPTSAIRVGRHRDNAVQLLGATAGRDGVALRLDYGGTIVEFASGLLGDYNVENLLVLAGIALAMEVPAHRIGECFAQLQSVPGRLERVDLGEDAPLVLIDYAHTPDALESVLRSLRSLTQGSLRVVFGCGGDRDRGKRPQMARAAATGSDEAYLTLDNPRTEEPAQIFADARYGFEGQEAHTLVIEDRAQALHRALSTSGSKDTLLVAGKGHENYQIIGRQKVAWDDREVLRRAWAEGGAQ
jgi:UDP-N-acetylmuramoyl-L-alanyl-D-glutamate--2,6-diaminopimelate ligase